MRRKINNKKILIAFIVLSGLFNLMSFVFDQMVVQSESKKRSISTQIDNSQNKVINLIFFKNFLESEISSLTKTYNFLDKRFTLVFKSNAIFDPLAFNIQDKSKLTGENNVTKFHSKDDIEHLNQYFLNQLQVGLLDFNSKLDQIKLNFKTNSKFLEIVNNKYLKENFNEEKLNKTISKLYIDKKIINDFNNEIINTKEKKSKNFEIYEIFNNKLSGLLDLRWDYRDLRSAVKQKYALEIIDFYDHTRAFSNIESKTNLYILISISSQILGLIFLLFVFRIFIKEII